MRHISPVLILLLVLKLVSLAAATAQTAGVVGFFAIDALKPHKWTLLIGGTLTILVSEGLGYLVARLAGGRADRPET